LKFSKGEGKAKKKPKMQIYPGRIEVMDSTENMALKSANTKKIHLNSLYSLLRL